MSDRFSIHIDHKELDLTNPQKVLWPREGYTKADLINFYTQAAPYILPYLKGRPLTVVRWPDGIEGESFYQKNLPAYAPEWIPVVEVNGDKGVIRYPLCEDRATLAWMANQASIELHPWHSQASDPDHPDWFVIDLDPNTGATYEMVIEVALTVKSLLDKLGLRGYPKTSGATGLHIYLPVTPKYTYKQLSTFAGEIGSLIAELLPRVATNERWIKNRGPRVYLDHLQNLPGKTIVAPYSLRPLPGAPVSMPVTWEEVPLVRPGDFTLVNALDRMQKGDLFLPVLRDRQDLDQPMVLFPKLQKITQ